mgnify:CR=1 FL=1
MKITKGGKGIIVSSETDKRIHMRAPLDAIVIGKLMGMKQDLARNSVTKNCQQAIAHAHYRKTYKGVAEVKFDNNVDWSDDDDSEG